MILKPDDIRLLKEELNDIKVRWMKYCDTASYAWQPLLSFLESLPADYSLLLTPQKPGDDKPTGEFLVPEDMRGESKFVKEAQEVLDAKQCPVCKQAERIRTDRQAMPFEKDFGTTPHEEAYSEMILSQIKPFMEIKEQLENKCKSLEVDLEYVKHAYQTVEKQRMEWIDRNSALLSTIKQMAREE